MSFQIDLIISSVVLAWFTAAFAQAALSPEETLYTYTTCFDKWAPPVKDADKRKETAQTWFRDWEFTPDQQSTHCFLKCVLEHLQIYNPQTNQFQLQNIENQRKEYELFNHLSADQVKPLIGDLNKLSPLPQWPKDCTSLYKAYMPVYKKYKKEIQALYHGSRELTETIYVVQKDKLKQRDETYVHFCEKQFYPDRTKNLRLCNIRGFNLNVVPDDTLRKHIDCIFKGFRYVSMDGNFYASELQRDFHKIGLNNSAIDRSIENILSKCADTSAYGYYVCLLKSDQANAFKAAFSYREFRSADYKSVIKGDQLNWAKVVQMQKDVAAKICPTPEELNKMLSFTKSDYFTLGESLIFKN